MSLQDRFEEEMREVCQEYYELDKERDAIEEQLEKLRDYMEITLRKYSQDEFDVSEVPVKVKRATYISHRMKSGAKEKLKEILSPEQFSELYEEKKVDTIRVTPLKET
ncbi:hypothetical protein EU537_11640 [Candidatus Thorarchaeota archaeon]|nr:MAG: hypothetical protein EU537_11640 [Candidatus Thorarchaeota archaeon]